MKIEELLSSVPDVFSTTEDILIVGFNEQGKDHDAALDKVLSACRQANLTLNEYKCHFRCITFPFFGEVIWKA